MAECVSFSSGVNTKWFSGDELGVLAEWKSEVMADRAISISVSIGRT